MSYRGDPANIGIPELESVRRLREGAVRLPDGSGFFVGTVGKKKRKRESVEGGPGSGPHGGKDKGPKRKDVKEHHDSVRRVEKHYAASSGKSSEMSKAHKAAMDKAIEKSRDLRGQAREASNTYGNHPLAMRLLDRAETGMDKAWGAHAEAYNQRHWGTKNPD